MKVWILALALAACGGAPSPPPSHPTSNPPPASPNGASVDLPAGGKAFLALPASPGKTPGVAGKRGGVIVIQEWWGLNDWVKEQTTRFAGKGYVALAVDLYRGRVASSPDEAHELSRGLPEDRALADLEAGFAMLAARDDVDPARIGSIGWCMGGGFSLALATHEPKLRAAVINYGRLVTAPATLDAVHASLLGNFGGTDRGIPAADVRAFEAQMKERKKDVDIKIYDNAGHAFMNPNNNGGYVADSATDAWTRVDAFFAKTIGGS